MDTYDDACNMLGYALNLIEFCVLNMYVRVYIQLNLLPIYYMIKVFFIKTKSVRIESYVS